MARDDDVIGDGNGGGGGEDDTSGNTTTEAPPGSSVITAVVNDPEDLQVIQQKVNESGCVQRTTSRDTPDGTEIVIEVECSEAIARLVAEFIFRTLNRPPGVRRDTLPDRDRIRLERLENRLERGEKLADILLNPPESFGKTSQELATRLAEILENFEFLGKTLVFAVVVSLASQSPAEAVAKLESGYDLAEASQALFALPVIAKARMRQQIQLELAQQPPRIPPSELDFWKDLEKALK